MNWMQQKCLHNHLFAENCTLLKFILKSKVYLSFQLSFISSIPLLILLFAVLLALYPTLEGITATSASEVSWGERETATDHLQS